MRDPEPGTWGDRVVADIVLDGDRSLARALNLTQYSRLPGSALAERGWCEEAVQRAADAERARCADFIDRVGIRLVLFGGALVAHK